MGYVVCGFGHRNIFDGIESADEILVLKESLTLLLETIIENEESPVFMTGMRGEFDNLFASVVRILKENKKSIKLVLVEPYFSDALNKYKDYFEVMYDSIIIPDEIAGAYPKKAITLRNKWMVEQSDSIVSYVNKEQGGAYNTLKYAKSLNKTIYNLGDLDFE